LDERLAILRDQEFVRRSPAGIDQRNRDLIVISESRRGAARTHFNRNALGNLEMCPNIFFDTRVQVGAGLRP
jgi:hypothetical protein